MSIRLRLALIYSAVLFGLAALVVAGIYVALAHAIASEPVHTRYQLQSVPGGQILQSQQVESLERAVNENTLQQLRTYSFSALAMLFAASVGVGWVVAGSMLRPIGRITDVARDISATDLSRRIDLEGPDDELHDLADTFDEMLGRLDHAFTNQQRFIQEASHELRNPLAVIRTNLEVTLADPAATTEDLRHTAEVVQRSSERMTRLVDDLLLYARNEVPTIQREPLDAGALVREATEEFRAPAEARGLKIDWDAPADLLIPGDGHALRQALANLLANATRLAPPGSRIRVRAGREEPWVWLAVDDQGPGIAPEDQERVFQRFWRGTTPTGAGQEKRSGLGLAIVRQIAEAHGGEVKLVSTPGVGSTFALWLPGSESLSKSSGPFGESVETHPAAASAAEVAPVAELRPIERDPVRRA